jgi:tripartite-type tricarboxylate transporter receptor subunit TctC
MLGAAAGLALTSAAATAADYPDKPIRWIIGFGPGGASDYLARTVAAGLEKALGTEVVVENRPGASGIIAAGTVHEMAPDGYTIVLVSSSYFNNIALGRSFDFDPLDFEFVTRVAQIPNIVVVPADSEIDSIQGLIDAAKADPGGLDYASGGVGTGTHIGTELFKSRADVDMQHIPYKGTKEAILDLVSGRVDVMFAGASPSLPQIESGQLRAIAVTSAQPASVLPDVPPVADALEGFEAVTWYGVFAPKGTPEDIVAKLNEAFNEALTSDEVKSALAERGFDPAPTSPSGFQDYLENHIAQTKDVAAKADITLQ